MILFPFRHFFSTNSENARSYLQPLFPLHISLQNPNSVIQVFKMSCSEWREKFYQKLNFHSFKSLFCYLVKKTKQNNCKQSSDVLLHYQAGHVCRMSATELWGNPDIEFRHMKLCVHTWTHVYMEQLWRSVKILLGRSALLTKTDPRVKKKGMRKWRDTLEHVSQPFMINKANHTYTL